MEFNSKKYWETRYAEGGNSGNGSYGELAKYKANFINTFIKHNNIKSVVEFGCGDGNQLSMFNVENYMGFDVSQTILDKCLEKFKNDQSKSFHLYTHSNIANYVKSPDLVLSLDVIFHLIEDHVYNTYITKLADSVDKSKFLIVYSSNTKNNEGVAKHVRHRKFVDDLIPKGFELIQLENNPFYNQDHRKGSFANFFVFKKQ